MVLFVLVTVIGNLSSDQCGEEGDMDKLYEIKARKHKYTINKRMALTRVDFTG